MEQLKSSQELVHRQLESLKKLVAQKEDESKWTDSLLPTARAGYLVGGGALPVSASNNSLDMLCRPLAKRKVIEQPISTQVSCDLKREIDDGETISPPPEKKQRSGNNIPVPASQTVLLQLIPTDFLPQANSFPLSEMVIQTRLQNLSRFTPPVKRRGEKQLSIEDYRDFGIRYLRGEGSDHIQKTMGITKRRYYDMIDRLKGFEVILEIDIAERNKHLLSKRN